MVSIVAATTAGESTRQQPGLACEECRRRKARCDRVRPRCGICSDSGRNCVVLDKRSQRGPKKGQLKDLRSRLMMLEQRLEGQNDALNLPQERDNSTCPTPSEKVSPEADLVSSSASTDIGLDTCMSSAAGAFALFGTASCSDKMPPLTPDLATATTTTSMTACICKGWQTESGIFSTSPFPQIPLTPQSATAHSRMPSISLAAADPVMPDVVLMELDLLYFERVHPFAPMIHKRRYYAWAGDSNASPARTALRSAMRTIASAMSPQFCDIGQVMYASTRRMLETQDACPDTGLPWMTRIKPPHEQHKIEPERIQAWLLLAYYDVLRKSEHQAFITARRAFRLLRLSGLCEMDADAYDSRHGHVATCTPPAEPSWCMQMCSEENDTGEAALKPDWISVEEKRRTVWSAFLLDRLSTMVNDQPTMLMEETFHTRLPMPEADFQNCAQEPTSQMGFLVEATDGSKARNATTSPPPFAHCVVVANLFARCMTHCKLAMQSTPMSAPEAQDFWIRHQWLASAAANACESAVARCDPMLVFTRILAYSASLSLCSTANATSWQTLDHHLMAMACKPAAHQAASEVVRIIKTAPRIAFFKMHPFFPNAIALVTSFLNADVPYLPSPRSSNTGDSFQERQDAVNDLLAALRRTSQVNNLAAELLCRLELDIGQAASDGSVSQFDQADSAWA